MPAMLPAQQADFATPGQQLMSQIVRNASKPLSWNAAPFGSQAGQVPGVTLNS